MDQQSTVYFITFWPSEFSNQLSIWTRFVLDELWNPSNYMYLLSFSIARARALNPRLQSNKKPQSQSFRTKVSHQTWAQTQSWSLPVPFLDLGPPPPPPPWRQSIRGPVRSVTAKHRQYQYQVKERGLDRRIICVTCAISRCAWSYASRSSTRSQTTRKTDSLFQFSD